MPGMAGGSVEITMIKVDKISPNVYNPNIIMEDIWIKLTEEIKEKGLCEPIIVRKAGDGYEVVDGEHRLNICRDLGWEEIPCIIQDFDDKEARIKTIQLNYMRGSPIPLKLASLIHDLNKEIKLEDLAKRLPYEEVQLMDSLELLKLPDNLDKTIEAQALKEEEEMPLVISFVLYKKQLEVVEKAINTAFQDLPKETKNQKAVALEKICAQFIEQEGLKKEPEAAEEKKESV
jgi:ParB family transcriptional regulator, chromosome partitioning protein